MSHWNSLLEKSNQKFLKIPQEWCVEIWMFLDRFLTVFSWVGMFWASGQWTLVKKILWINNSGNFRRQFNCHRHVKMHWTCARIQLILNTTVRFQKWGSAVFLCRWIYICCLPLRSKRFSTWKSDTLSLWNVQYLCTRAFTMQHYCTTIIIRLWQDIYSRQQKRSEMTYGTWPTVFALLRSDSNSHLV